MKKEEMALLLSFLQTMLADAKKRRGSEAKTTIFKTEGDQLVELLERILKLVREHEERQQVSRNLKFPMHQGFWAWWVLAQSLPE